MQKFTFLGLLLQALNPEKAASLPLKSRYGLLVRSTPIEASGEIWAKLVANVAPLMSLVGERNTKDFLRVSSTGDQYLLMAVAPLGLFSLVVCAIRLSGPRLIRRVIGRESERLSEALVELTPLSVAPATSVFTLQGVEIEPSEQRDRVAFVCAHVSKTDDIAGAFSAFKSLLLARIQRASGGKASDDRDSEIVLGIQGHTLDAKDTAQLVRSLIKQDQHLDLDLINKSGCASASLSYRSTGISPTQTAPKFKTSWGLVQCCNLMIGLLIFTAMCGIHIFNLMFDNRDSASESLQTMIMGLAGYVGVVVFTFQLLVIIKKGVKIERLSLDPVFDQATWTFSDSRHAEHKAFKLPSGRCLVQAAPASLDREVQQRHQIRTALSCGGLIGSWVVCYLGLRVARWWVPLSSLGLIWISAAYRALTIKSFLVSKEMKPKQEHWLGIFRDNLYDSLIETVAVMENNVIRDQNLGLDKTRSDDTSTGEVPLRKLNDADNGAASMVIIAKPIRQSLRNWSGCEDVMKVSLEMAKHICESHTWTSDCYDLQYDGTEKPPFQRLIRFRLMIYVPGLIWEADSFLDYIVTDGFNFECLYRDMLKILHLCSNFRGNVSQHSLAPKTSAMISNVLCGPITEANDLPSSMTLMRLLTTLRDLTPRNWKSYTLEQSLLLPTIQLATMYETFPDVHTHKIAAYQNSHIDHLKLSGAKYLATLEEEFERHDVWDHFMVSKAVDHGEGQVKPRNETSGLYGRPVIGRGPPRKSDEFYRDEAFRNRQCSERPNFRRTVSSDRR